MSTQEASALEMSSGPLTRRLLRFALPVMFTGILQLLYNAADIVVVGQFAETADVSAVSMGSQIMYMASLAILGFAAAVTVVMGQYFGAKQTEKLSPGTGL